MIEYSIVVPVYNAENSIQELAHQIEQFFGTKHTYEIIFIDDYSKDDSWQKILAVKAINPNISAIRLSKNFGQHGATLCGFKYAKGTFAITLDDDLEVQPQEIEKLITCQKHSKADVVYGIYKKGNNSFIRKVLTSCYKTVAKIEGKNKGKGSSFRLIKKDIYQKLAANHSHFVFIDELILWYTSNVSFENTVFNPNFISKKRYKTGGLIKITSNLILFSSSFPLKIVTYLGVFLASGNFLIGLYFIIKKLFFKLDSPGFAAIIVSVLFSTGIIIFSIGIIAQYIRHVLMSVNNVPSFNESEIHQHVNP